MKQHTCLNCKVTTTSEDIIIQTDFEAIKTNKQQVMIYKAACRLYELKLLEHKRNISNYRRIAACHNESKHFWQSHWIVYIDHCGTTYIYLDDGWYCYEASSKYPSISGPTHPHQMKLLTKYIECPVCKFKHYVE